MPAGDAVPAGLPCHLAHTPGPHSPTSGPSPSRTISPRSASYFLAVQGITLTCRAHAGVQEGGRRL